MDIFKIMEDSECKEVVFFEEKEVGLKAIFVIHNTTLGPALARCKMYNYSNQDEALRDAMYSASHNTYVSALLKRGMGGGSVVLIGDPNKEKSEMYFRALGNILNRFNGKIYLTNGSGIDLNDMAYVKKESSFVLGIHEKLNSSGESSFSIAKGMICGIKAIVKACFDKSDLENLNVVVQGVGNVGNKLVYELIKEKVKLKITDLNYDKIKNVQDMNPEIQVVQPDVAFKEKCDIFVSCASDGVITEKNVDQIKAKIITGSISKFSYDNKILEKLKSKGIIIIPGYLINAGEMIQLCNELEGYDRTKTQEDLNEIYYNILNILQDANSVEGSSLQEISLSIAKKYLKDIALIKTLK